MNSQDKRQTEQISNDHLRQTEQKTDPADLAMITCDRTKDRPNRSAMIMGDKQNKRQTQQISNDHGRQTEQKTDPTD